MTVCVDIPWAQMRSLRLERSWDWAESACSAFSMASFTSLATFKHTQNYVVFSSDEDPIKIGIRMLKLLIQIFKIIGTVPVPNLFQKISNFSFYNWISGNRIKKSWTSGWCIPIFFSFLFQGSELYNLRKHISANKTERLSQNSRLWLGQLYYTCCLWLGERRSEKGELAGFSKASSARVRSSSCST